MMLFKLISVACLATLASTQDYQDFQNVGRQAPLRLSSSNEPKPTPVPILKQINRHNEDGSYTYGYEGADGSFKIETKLATGEVKGKYGYTDETGKVRIVEYGANKYGFQPSGEGITVAPPTLVDETTDKNGNLLPDYEDEPVQRAPAPKYRPQKAPRPIAPPQQQQYYEYETQPIQQNYQHQPAAPKYTAPIAPSTRISAPAPPRLQIPGAQQAPLDVVYSKTPRPARFDDYEDVGPQTFPQQQQHQPQARKDAFPAQLFTQAAPSPPKQNQVAYQAPRLQQAPPQNFAPQGRSSGGGVLDQLAKDYALPSGGTPLHDISFGYY